MPKFIVASPGLHYRRPAASSAQGLADQLKLAAIAVDRIKTPMVVTDPRQPDNPIVLANQAFLDLIGYSADEVVGRNCRFLQGPCTAPEALMQIRFAISEEREINVELHNYRKDGTEFCNQLHISPIHDDEGQLLYFFASQEDVTELRKVQVLEATERRLLKEIDHRALNVLAVVNGIVRLSRSDDAKIYAASIQQRVQALAAAHALLAEKGWRDVALDQVVRRQFDGVQSDRIRTGGPDIMVSSSIVQPLALAVHELLLNANVHGALSGLRGTLTVTWNHAPQIGGFEIRWEEADGPSSPVSRRPGFGTMILRSLIKRQLRGDIHQEWTGYGMVTTIKVPGNFLGLPTSNQTVF